MGPMELGDAPIAAILQLLNNERLKLPEDWTVFLSNPKNAESEAMSTPKMYKLTNNSILPSDAVDLGLWSE